MAVTEYQVEVDNVTETNWTDILEQFEDAHIYQTWSYGAIRWGKPNLSHLVLRQSGRLVAAAQLRIIKARLIPGGIAYMRWGPLCEIRGHPLRVETLKQMALALHEEYVQKRRLFLRILPNSVNDSPQSVMFNAAFAEFTHSKAPPKSYERTFLLDLTPPLDELRKKLDQKWRNQLNRAEKNELTIIEGQGSNHYRVFSQLYQKMWSRKKFETTVDIEEFGRLCDELPSPLKFQMLVCEHQGIPVGAIVCSALGNTGIYLLGATDDDGLNTKCAYLLQWAMIKWLKQKGFRYYDLGGIDPEGNPGVFHFKRGISGTDVSRIPPFESCQSTMSSLLMQLADIRHIGLRMSVKKWLSQRSGIIVASKSNNS